MEAEQLDAVFREDRRTQNELLLKEFECADSFIDDYQEESQLLPDGEITELIKQIEKLENLGIKIDNLPQDIRILADMFPNIFVGNLGQVFQRNNKNLDFTIDECLVMGDDLNCCPILLTQHKQLRILELCSNDVVNKHFELKEKLALAKEKEQKEAALRAQEEALRKEREAEQRRAHEEAARREREAERDVAFIEEVRRTRNELLCKEREAREQINYMAQEKAEQDRRIEYLETELKRISLENQEVKQHNFNLIEENDELRESVFELKEKLDTIQSDAGNLFHKFQLFVNSLEE